MSRDRASRHLPVVVTILIALALMMVPLPRGVDVFRPDWVAVLMIFWAFSLPRSYSVGVAFLLGIVIDVAQGTLLGQHALALVAVVYLTVKFHLLMRVFPLLQLMATVFALLALYQFLLFWVNGISNVSAPSVTYWGPVVSGTLLWPILFSFLNGLRYRVQSRV
ncbi:MAG TPA: rod shape-determining protein MreD [Woeseiaceae bacterium]|nr:rod shape-determining protein MreD [Woeseiaceae bacterium]